jgi:hypothetical protein
MIVVATFVGGPVKDHPGTASHSGIAKFITLYSNRRNEPEMWFYSINPPIAF